MDRKNHDFFLIKLTDLSNSGELIEHLQNYDPFFRQNIKEMIKGHFYYSRLNNGTCYLFVPSFVTTENETSPVYLIRFRKRVSRTQFEALRTSDVCVIDWDNYSDKLVSWIRKEGIHATFGLVSAHFDLQVERATATDGAHCIASRMKVLREQKCLTTQQVARALRCSVTRVTQWESGLVIPNSLQIVKLAKEYSTTVEYLVNGI